MVIFLQISGGFAGLRISGSVESQTLSLPLQKQIEAKLSTLPAVVDCGNPHLCDGETYEIELQTSLGRSQHVVTVPSPDDQLDELLNDLKLEIIQRNRNG